jgi:hypothetical protein
MRRLTNPKEPREVDRQKKFYTDLRIRSAIDSSSPKHYTRMDPKPESEKPNQEIFTRGKMQNSKRNKHITLPSIKF